MLDPKTHRPIPPDKLCQTCRLRAVLGWSDDHQVDTKTPMGKAMFTIIGAMAELESSLISGRVKAGMAAAKARGKKPGRPETPPKLVMQIEDLAETTDLSINRIRDRIKNKVSRAVVGQIVKRVRHHNR